MNQHSAHLLDLPYEILFLILKNLDNVDVLYSLLDINNQRLDIIAQEQIFSNILNFVFITQSTDEISTISDSILDRFCVSILPRVHKNVKSLIVESVSMECIFRAGIYPNLTELKLFNFNKEIISRYFTDDSLFGHICKQQIMDLILVINENNFEETREEYTKNVYEIILGFFENLKHLTIVLSSVDNYVPLSLYNLPSMTFSSSILNKLYINVYAVDDVLALLDGRLKQLTTFIVQVELIGSRISTSYNNDDLLNLKCFSLICHKGTFGYDNLVVPLLRRMVNLEELTLYLHIWNGPTFISGTHLDNEILIYMPRLRIFTFYLAANRNIDNSVIRVSDSDIQRTFTNIKQRQVASMVDYFESYKMICRVFSLPFKFYYLEQISNNIPNILFNSVTHLKLWDKKAFKDEFFIRLNRAFPFLKNLFIWNIMPPHFEDPRYNRNNEWCSIIEYPHLVSLDIECTNIYYVELFLNETKTRLPLLTKLKVMYSSLEFATKGFTRVETQRNCARVKQLIVQDSRVYPKNVYHYFPLLLV